MVSLHTFTKWKMQESVIRKKENRTRRKVSETVGKCNSKRIDYYNYKLKPEEEILCLLEGMGIVVIFSYFFYKSAWAMLLLSPIIYFYRREKIKIVSKKKIEALEMQFKEMIAAIHTNLQAGYSMENAFLESYQDIVHLFGPDSDMAKELMIIRKGMANGITLERLLWDLGNRCPGSEIAEFAEVYTIASQTGGKWNEIMRKTVTLIQEKMEMKEEISTLIHARKTESRIMCVIPFFILCYMDLTSKGYFDVLYHNLAGVAIMTICMVLYCFAFYIAEKITEISL